MQMELFFLTIASCGRVSSGKSPGQIVIYCVYLVSQARLHLLKLRASEKLDRQSLQKFKTPKSFQSGQCFGVGISDVAAEGTHMGEELVTMLLGGC